MFTESKYNSDSIFGKIAHLLSCELPGVQAYMQMKPEGRELFPPDGRIPVPSAVLILLYRSQGQILFPLIRRPKYNGAHSGQMAFPGGKFEAGDITLHATALRESREEIGIIPEQITIIGELTKLYIPVTNMEVLPVVGTIEIEPDFLANPNEVERIHTIRLHDILNPDLKRCEYWQLHGKEVKVPYYLLDGQIVWGATALILSEFEAVLRNIFPNGELR